MNVFDPSQWADVSGWVIVMVFSVVTIFGMLMKLVSSAKWQDWLDEPSGRGSVRDDWGLLNHQDRCR